MPREPFRTEMLQAVGAVWVQICCVSVAVLWVGLGRAEPGAAAMWQSPAGTASAAAALCGVTSSQSLLFSHREHSWTQPLIPRGTKSTLPPVLADFHLDPQPGESFLQPHRARTLLFGVTPPATGITDRGEHKGSSSMTQV